MERSRILTLLFVAVMAVMLLPELQRRFRIFELTPLEGAFEVIERPDFSAGRFIKGNYQQEIERFIEEKAGFRPLLVRIRNQVDFLLYRKAHAEGVIIARKGVVIEEDYILEYLGRLFIGKNTIDKKLDRIKFLQDTLSQKGIRLAIVFAPGKASFHADLIPNRYRPDDKSLSNYDYFIQQCRTLGINHLDLNQYFRDMKSTAPYPLYPKFGTHWSTYGMSLAADTLVKYVGSLSGKPLNQIKYGPVDLTSNLRDTDFDGGKSMNLLWKPRTDKMAYPRLSFENDAQKHRPMVLVVADSYYWNIYNAGIPKNIFANEAFWYYHRQVYPDFYVDQKTVDQLDIRAEIEKQEVILVMITERFLHTAFWHFTDDLYRIYKPGFQEDHLYNYGNSIRRDRQWFGDVIEKAKKRGLSIEEMIQVDAEYMFMLDFNEKIEKTRDNYIIYYSLMIKNDPEWYEQVLRKAHENALSVEEMLHRDAAWMYEHDILGMHR
jgi:hypothetical protein